MVQPSASRSGRHLRARGGVLAAPDLVCRGRLPGHRPRPGQEGQDGAGGRLNRQNATGSSAINTGPNLIAELCARLRGHGETAGTLKEMATVTVQRWARPTRLAFIIDHRSTTEFLQVFQINTVLWGGMFNLVVPTAARTPRVWQSKSSARDIARGYIDAFNPDFVVTGSGIDATAYGVETDRIVSLVSLLSVDGLRECGMDVMPIYHWRYAREFQFIQRTPTQLRTARFSGKSHGLLGPAIFGEFPGEGLEFFARAFRDMGGVDIEVTPDTYLETLSETEYPLSLGCQDLAAPGPIEPTFYLLDPRSSLDLADFWNLRALGWNISAVPLPWADEVALKINQLYSDREMGLSRGLRILKSRSVAKEDFDAFVALVKLKRILIQTWYPRIWESEVRRAHGVQVPELRSSEQSQDCPVNDSHISFNTVAPRFASTRKSGGSRFVNVVNLRSYDAPDLATVIPNVTNLSSILGPNTIGNVRCSREGIAVLSRGEERIQLRVPHGLQVFRCALQQIGDVQLSAAGRIADRMITLLGGPSRAGLVANIDLLNMFEKAATCVSRDILYGELLALLTRINGSNADLARRRIAAMLAQQIIKLGLRLQCGTCSQHGWFALDELRDNLRCNFCLDAIRFPTNQPPSQPLWSYRALGPFGVRGFANGAYVVAAALRALLEIDRHARTSWVPSFTLTMSETRREVDFGIYWKPDFPRFHNPLLMLGECKTFDSFSPVDVRRMRELARMMPGAVIVFATLKDNLSAEEKGVIGAFAKAGRRGWRHPVVVLTARELTARSGILRCWEDKGMMRGNAIFDKLSQRPLLSAGFVGARRLADATQQLYLDLEADSDWPHHE